MKVKIYSNVREIEIDEESYCDNFKVEENFKFLEDFKSDFINTKAICKSCKREVKESLITGIVGCPKCYNYILKLVSNENKKVTLYNSKNLEKFLNLDNKKYSGRRPEKVREYFSLKTKIFELENELKISVEAENYSRCNIIKETIKDFNSKLLKIRRKING